MRRAWVLALLATGCGSSSLDGSTILNLPYAALRGNIVFATNAVRGSGGYDLYAIPFPNIQAGTAVTAIQLTSGSDNETQPAVSITGAGMAFAGPDGIYVITAPEGRMRRITNNAGTTFVDTLPAVSPNADRVAWVRNDTMSNESYIMIGNFDGTSIKEVHKKPGVAQDAPAFDPRPDPRVTRLAWTEFVTASIVGGNGPADYGIWLEDYTTGTGLYICHAQNFVTPGADKLPPRDPPYRCFGQHLVWPNSDTMVLAQDMLEVNINGADLHTVYPELLTSFSRQTDGSPVLSVGTPGFFPAFPLSSSYAPGVQFMTFDGVINQIEGDGSTHQIFVAALDGTSVSRVHITNLQNSVDTITTANYLFSVATPRIVPP
ncbi:MAG: hypothetical protein U1E65_17365 [Myxococcota bacterium]